MLRSLADTYVVGRAVPLTCPTDAGVNPLPLTCTVTAPVPATTLAGVRLVSTGTAGMSATVSVALCAITIPSFTQQRTSTRLNTSHVTTPYAVLFPHDNVFTWALNVCVPVTPFH